MKKSKLIFAAAAVIGIFAGMYLLLRFDEDADLDFIDEDFEGEDDVPPVKEEKPAKASSKVRRGRGYIPIKFHNAETAE